MEKERGLEGGEDYDLTIPEVELTPEQEKIVNELLARDPKLSKGEAIRLVLKGIAGQKNE